MGADRLDVGGLPGGPGSDHLAAGRLEEHVAGRTHRPRGRGGAQQPPEIGRSQRLARPGQLDQLLEHPRGPVDLLGGTPDDQRVPAHADGGAHLFLDHGQQEVLLPEDGDSRRP